MVGKISALHIRVNSVSVDPHGARCCPDRVQPAERCALWVTNQDVGRRLAIDSADSAGSRTARLALILPVGGDGALIGRYEVVLLQIGGTTPLAGGELGQLGARFDQKQVCQPVVRDS